ncbi:hypothetical protein EJB05_22937, partial [Eragrostis curvula]
MLGWAKQGAGLPARHDSRVGLVDQPFKVNYSLHSYIQIDVGAMGSQIERFVRFMMKEEEEDDELFLFILPLVLSCLDDEEDETGESNKEEAEENGVFRAFERYLEYRKERVESFLKELNAEICDDEFNISRCIAVVESIEELTCEEKAKAVELLEDVHNREIFLCAEPNVRLVGIAAAIKSKHPDWSPAAIKSAIMTTADVTDRSGGPILDEQRHPADWFAIGAGHVNPGKAADPGLVYDIAPSDYISVNCSAVTVISDTMLNYPSISVVFPRTWNRSRPMVVQRTAKSVGKVPSTYTVKVDMPAGGATIDVSPSKLVFTAANQEQSFNVTVWPRQQSGAKVARALRRVSGTFTVRSPISIYFN